MIIFERIVIENFRRYKSTTFEFNKKNINNFNIIVARNGVGKSTLFDAFTWCLFNNEDHLDIDPKYLKETEGILNTTIKRNLKPGDKTGVSVVVFLNDLNNKTQYKIE